MITSVQNPKIKHVLRLRDRRYRDRHGETLVEGFRELRQALGNGHIPINLYYCPPFFLGVNEPELLQKAQKHGTLLQENL